MFSVKDTRIWPILLLAVLLAWIAAPVQAADKGPVKLAYVEWSSEIASTNLVRAVIQEKLGHSCEIVPMQADQMWKAVAEGEVDAMVSAWLPETQKKYYEKYSDQCVDLGPNLEGAKTGLVVPNVTLGRQTAATGLRNKPYIKAESIADLSEYADKFHRMIVGIDPQAGVMHNTREAMRAYGLERFTLTQGSEQTMTSALGRAISKQEWIVVTGWVPHWMFARWELKFLEDPKGVFGGEEHINTIAREGLAEDMPDVAEFLDNFYWEPEDMGQLMVWIHDDKGLYPYEKALRYIRTHPDQVNSWLP
ncbi:glycine betaine ABC transporter substrate-binding protein [Desulfovermiculus halophilus]|jgi:glycine betaine/proline transport system substrate-binding protein|uniref:glycine betaine ABC transporter substrate-binding protein n=1 Tax=Desulfovermiculus halophilus TaxID=339722 RepID=UPI000480ED13|nr:glycine betaine ABC transporter substrate-binding protein [Desulfovermiculus halophilus]